MGPVFQKAGQGNYVQFVAPGVIAMTVLFSSVFSGIGLLFDRQFGFLKETLVAPVPRFQVMFGRTLGASTVAVIQGTLVMVVCFMAGFRVVKWAEFPLAFVFMGMIACLFAALGTAIGSMLENMQGFQLIMNFLVMPIFFLSGALYPLKNLPKGLSVITSINPLAYGVDGLRGTLIGVSHFGAAVDTAVLCGVAAVLLVVASHLFSKIEA
jgi:ABC-2 type transport system permease protein